MSALRGTKLRRRALAIITNGINTLLMPLLSPLVSLLVVQLASPDLWGAFVHVAIIAQLGAHVAGWGNKEYLLRQFSQSPSQIAHAWRSSLIGRALPFAGFCVIVGLIGFAPLRALLIVLWCLGQVLDQSYDALVTYRRAFGFAAAVDLCGLVVMCVVVAWFGPRLTLDVLLGLFAATSLASAAVLALRFRHTLAGVRGQGSGARGQGPGVRGQGSRVEGSGVRVQGSGVPPPDTRYPIPDTRYPIPYTEAIGFLRGALPFFLLGLSGMIQSRADLYVVNAFLPRSEVATYQVFTNMLIYIQTVAYIILSPFVKNIYRMPHATILKLTGRLFAVGALIVVPALLAVYGALTWLYHLAVPPLALVAGGMVVLPSFCYLPIIYTLYRERQQSVVLWTNVLGIGANLLLSLLLLPRFGILGAVSAGALAQWLMLIAYLARRRNLWEGQIGAMPELP